MGAAYFSSIVVAFTVVIAVRAVPFIAIPVVSIVVIAVLSDGAIVVVATIRCNDATG
jgi:hypothetical protein